MFGLNEKLQPTMQDMNERLDDPDIIAGVRDTGGRVTLAIYDCNKPVIAAINGAAVGIGATMTCAMDIRLASEHARIGFVFNKIGITPEACSSWFLPRIVGIAQALEWVYSADILKAEEALAGRFVKAVVPADQLLEEAYKIARRIAQFSPVAIALTRQMMYRCAAQPHPDRGAQGGLPRHLLHQPQQRQGGCAILPGETPAGVYPAHLHRHAALLPLVGSKLCVRSWRLPLSLSRCCWTPSALASSCPSCRTLSWTFPATR